jgi:hypothetical protein
MIANTRNERHYGLSPVHALGIVTTCMLVFMALLALVPDA